MSVRVRFPFRVLERLAARRKTDLQPFLFRTLASPQHMGDSDEFCPPKTFSNHKPTLIGPDTHNRQTLCFTDHDTDTFG